MYIYIRVVFFRSDFHERKNQKDDLYRYARSSRHSAYVCRFQRAVYAGLYQNGYFRAARSYRRFCLRTFKRRMRVSDKEPYKSSQNNNKRSRGAV